MNHNLKSVQNKRQFNRNAFQEAIKKRDFMKIQELLELLVNEVDINANNRNALHEAITKRDFKKVQELLANGVDINTKNSHGISPLFVALGTASPHGNLIMMLLRSGACVSEKDKLGNTPLHIAIRNNKSINVVSEILKRGADVNAKNSSNDTPLFTALYSSSENDQIIKLSNYRASGLLHYIPLHMMMEESEWEKFEILQKLLKFGANVNVKNYFGDTPLFVCLKNPKRNEDFIMELLKYGASVSNITFRKKSLFDLVLKRKGSLNLIRELLKQGACVEDLDLLRYEQRKDALPYLIKYYVVQHYHKLNFNMDKTIYCKEQIQCCKSEIEKMKEEYITDEFTLYEFVIKNYDYGKFFSRESDVLSNFIKFSHQLRIRYPNYHDFIIDKLLTETYLLSKLEDSQIFIKTNQNIIKINYYCLQIIGKYLLKEDLKNFIKAFCNLL